MKTDMTLENAAAWITNLDEQINQLQEQKEGLQAWILTQMGPGDREQAGDYLVTIRRGPRRLNTKRFEEAYPAEDFPQLYVTKTSVDNTAVKQQFAEQFLEDNGLYTTGRASVVIK